ncbi:MAG: hypothetical protein CJD30_03510 [Sulfuricurvum sp. PD_MW2]|uniref:hypothetical protein n=1 Tax=Sulfuricurvum sp. PD_MW2 TaxID=2027917 RepID=UPI000C05FCDB|nr:hypothetical protein [Sulfuricurvum sp. PD_MW2]PHM18040.1 MAG: hypothetical protein CJD30_03510 [Sulfuricurvum sp. PD_MW2]
MEIESVKKQRDGYLINGSTHIPDGYTGWMSDLLDEWLKNNTPEQEFTAEELQKQAEQEAENTRNEEMLIGFVYGTNSDGTDRRISVTKDDGDGMVQVKASFELGLTSTVIHFANGSKLPMTAEEFPKFALQFVTERGKFFS